MKLRTRILVALLLSLCMVTAAGCAGSGKKPTTNPGTDAEPVSEGTQLVFHLDELPSIGEFVSGETVRYFYEDGPHAELEARDDYGGLVPYIAAYKPFREPKYYTYVDYETGETVTEERDNYGVNVNRDIYGLMTIDGRIVTGGLWSECSVYSGPDGKGAYLLSRVAETSARLYEYGSDLLYCLVAFDGSWVLDFRNMPVSWISMIETVPCFEVYAENEILLYDMNGLLKTTIRFNETAEEKDHTYYGILVADEQRITVKKDVNIWYEDASEDRSYREIITFDWNGDPLCSFQTEKYPDLLGSSLFYVQTENYDGMIVLDRTGEQLDDQIYSKIYYGKAEHLFLAISEEDGDFTAAYFDENWKPVKPKNVSWTKDMFGDDCAFNTFSCEDKTVLCNYENDLITDFYGNPISLPVPESDILEKDFCWAYSDNYEFERNYLRIYTADSILICTPDGKLLREIKPLPGLTAWETQEAFQEIRNDEVLFFSCRDLYVVSISTGDVNHYQTDDPQTVLASYPLAESMNSDLSEYNGNLFLIWQGISGSEDSGFYESIHTAYSTTENKTIIRNIQSFRMINGYCLMATDDSLIVLSPDSTVLLKMRNNCDI